MSSKATDASVPAETVYQAEGCLFGTWKNVVIAAWTIQGTGPLADELERVTAPVSSAYPVGFSAIHLIAKRPPLPTSEAREKLIQATRTYSKNLACVGTVLEGSGFWASAIRSFIVGIRLVVPRSFEMQTYGSIAELAQWMAPLHTARTGVTVNAGELEKVLANFRRQVG
jgi:hypothetical protein